MSSVDPLTVAPLTTAVTAGRLGSDSLAGRVGSDSSATGLPVVDEAAG